MNGWSSDMIMQQLYLYYSAHFFTMFPVMLFFKEGYCFGVFNIGKLLHNIHSIICTAKFGYGNLEFGKGLSSFIWNLKCARITEVVIQFNSESALQPIKQLKGKAGKRPKVIFVSLL